MTTLGSRVLSLSKGTRRGADRQRAILEFIKTYHTRHGFAPTRREIGRGVHASTSVVSYNLAILQDDGRLTVARDVARGIVITEQAAPDNADWQVMNEVARRGHKAVGG